MKYLSRQFKQILLITCLLFCTGAVMAQTKVARDSRDYKAFTKAATKANVVFTLPEGFKDIPEINENNNFDYGITIPDQAFEIWFKVIPQNENAPDSLYLEMGRNQAKLIASENRYFVRPLTSDVLADYNADAGRTYFMSLPDSPETKRYKYALLITLQKNRKGTIMAVCLTNDRGPDFFKNISKARNCIKFKSGT